jgi:hypothetical protein
MTRHIDACPACVAFIRDLRAAIDRCRALQADCDPSVAAGLRSLLTREYLRLFDMPLPHRLRACKIRPEKKAAQICNESAGTGISSCERPAKG